MSMNSYVKAIVESDNRYDKMFAIYEACTAAGIEPPREVRHFFNGQTPNPDGMEVDVPFHHSTDDSRDFYDVHLDDLPEGTTIIRFVNSY